MKRIRLTLWDRNDPMWQKIYYHNLDEIADAESYLDWWCEGAGASGEIEEVECDGTECSDDYPPILIVVQFMRV